MEIPFYHDDVLNVHQAPQYTSAFDAMMKKDLNLNLNDQVVANLKPHLRDGDGILTSPDLGLLKLASPELERLIIQSNGMVTTTPTTGQFVYTKVASEEQEFAEGFVKALEDLHKQNQLGVQPNSLDISSVPVGPSLQPPPTSESPIYANLSSYPSGAMGTTVNYSTDTVPYPPPPSNMIQQPAPPPPRLQALKDEPQIVPEMASFGDSPPMSPINMDTQERIKAERKRLRNRIAASKCRKRKLERISRLEEKVKSLKTQNTELASTANLLREQVAQLKQKVMSHVNSGCQLLPQQVQAY
ncbi:jun D proto-oncogene S homeolog [Xenopus laevis]|uniref:Transcription factor JunD n=1 Tax=Xenopus laevis TaxID=8355 RepID=Q68FJ3_XENLA|nr:jun D proto-oncogene S homeolog [Xenopus laevis]AAH79782.1 MGC86303 protein [Xenopus laevis]